LDNLDHSKDDWEAHNESDLELDNASEDSETPEQQNFSTIEIVSGLIRPIQQTHKNVTKEFMTVNIMDMRRNNGIKKRSDRMRQCMITKLFM